MSSFLRGVATVPMLLLRLLDLRDRLVGLVRRVRPPVVRPASPPRDCRKAWSANHGSSLSESSSSSSSSSPSAALFSCFSWNASYRSAASGSSSSTNFSTTPWRTVLWLGRSRRRNGRSTTVKTRREGASMNAYCNDRCMKCMYGSSCSFVSLPTPSLRKRHAARRQHRRERGSRTQPTHASERRFPNAIAASKASSASCVSSVARSSSPSAATA